VQDKQELLLCGRSRDRHLFLTFLHGALLARGFWLYVWEIKSNSCRYIYVGRTGDTSSPHAQSPFNRIGQHLDLAPNAKGNALGKQLLRAGVPHEICSFEMIAIGPIFPEQPSFSEHRPKRDQMAASERAAADLLKARGYAVLGTHPRVGLPDPILLQQVQAILEARFPAIRDEEHERTLECEGADR
jgi:hypothetical protein